ncbi:response regulator transcription factor [Bordetella genomosp. 8]|uniref:response regulator transcription factor n=1 Tax=Bordetella genomosp. 8 TaxID=1416806 RepID=UPI001E4CADF5|nr:response regulator [Bordetella genomosp. 8]
MQCCASIPARREAAAAGVVFLVDDDAAVRCALARLIAVAGHRVMTFDSASEFLDHRYDGRTPACLVLDVRMPGVGGLDLQRELNAARAPLPIIFITGHGDVATTVQAMKEGANDFLTKPVEESALLRAVDQALCRAASDLHKRAEQDLIRHRLDRLTPREREVLALLVQGRLNKQAAYELGITEKTIKVHRAHVMEKMNVHTLVELARAADKAGVALPAAFERP